MPTTPLPTGQPFARRRHVRRPDSTWINVSVHETTATLLRYYAGGRKIGGMIDRLVAAYHAQQEERARLAQMVQQALAAVGGDATDVPKT